MASNEEGHTSSSEVQLLISQLLAASQSQQVEDHSQVAVESSPELDKEMFLQGLREFKCLWDTSDASYKNRTMKLNAWTTLSKMFHQEVPYLQKIFKNLKDSLKKCLDKRRTMTRSGAAAAALPVCKHFEMMRFLHEKTSNRPTQSNLDLDVSTLSDFPVESLQEEISPPKSSSSTPPLSSCSSTDEPVNRPLKRKSSNEQKSDPFIQQLKRMDDKMLSCIEQAKEKEKDEATSYCLSLIPVLQEFDKKKLRLAKIKIQQLLYDIEFVDE